MDLQALLVFIGGFAFCAVVGYIVSVLGAKEQTYEDALREQKERNKETKKPNKAKNTEIKKKKWNKKNKGEGGAEKNDTDVLDDDVVVVESVKEEEEPLVIEDTPEPSPLPTPEPKKPKAKKKKIVIEEVEEVVEEPVTIAPIADEEPVIEEIVKKAVEVTEPVVVVAPEPVAKVTPTKTKSKKQKAEAPLAPHSVAPGTPRELLATIKRTPFNDEEAQAVINVLLTKQSGGPLNNEEWIEQGKPSESQKLKQELTEVCKALEEERNNKTAFEKQLTTMRKDLNEKLAGVKKAAGTEHQRILADLAANHTHQMNQANGRLAELHNNEMAMRARLEELQLEKLHTVTTYQAQVDNLSHQLQMAQNVPTPTFNDPSLLSELEQLRSIRDRYEGQLNEFLLENKGLKERLGQLEGVHGQLQETREEVSRVSSSSSSLGAALTSAQSEATQLGLAKAKLEAELSRVSSQLEESKTAPEATAAAQAELVAVRSRLAEKESETVKLTEENERLSEQLASSVERPAADGEEAAKANGHCTEEEPQAPQPDQGKAMASQLEEWRDKYDLLHMDHEKMLAKQKVIQGDFEEKLASYQGEIQVATSKNNELTSSLRVAQGASSQLLARLFPSILDCTEEKVAAHLATLTDSSVVEARGEEVDRLEGQVEHYKTVLAQTESMLTSLQASVESAEAEWRLKLDAANKELIEVRGEASSLAAKAAALEREVAEAENTEEMQLQLAALQAQVLGQEAEKAQLESRNKELSAKADAMADQVKELSARQEELARGNTGLQAALGLAQQAVEKERGGIRALQEQLVTGKDGILGNGNGSSDKVMQ